MRDEKHGGADGI